MTIDPHAAPGPRTITLKTAGGTAAVPFELLAPARGPGFPPDDVIYLVMP
ncbi:MAG: hypothetical protein U0599_04925 [Vicinamibacteria bacterium]